MSVLSGDVKAKWLFGSVLPYAESAWARGCPSPYYKDSHRHLRAAMRSWVDENLMPHTLEWETSQILPDWLWEKAAKDGLIMPMAAGAMIPQEYISVVCRISGEDVGGGSGSGRVCLHENYVVKVQAAFRNGEAQPD